jgi:hypothetical protein
MKKKSKQRREKRIGSSGIGLAEVTKRDFEAFASILCRYNASDGMVDELARYFSSQNPRFDSRRFAKATKTCR